MPQREKSTQQNTISSEIPAPKKKLHLPAENAMNEAGGKPLPETNFPIVGIGASAGGLEALELFLANVPTDSGMGFVIVQHLDPTHKGILVELLQRSSAMPAPTGLPLPI